MKKFFIFLIATICLIAVGGYTILCTAFDTEHTLPGTVVNGTDIGNMTAKAAAAKLQKNSAGADTHMTVSLDGVNYTASVSEAFLFDYESSIKDALKKNPQKFWLRGLAWMKAFLLGNELPLPTVVTDADALCQALASAGFPDMDSYLRQPYKIQGDRLVFRAGAVPEKIDKDTLIENLRNAFQDGNYKDIIPCPFTPSGTADLNQIYQEVHKEPENATLDPENNYAVVEGKEGVDFDMETAKSAFETAKSGEETSVELFYPEPEVNAKDLEARMFSDTLSAYTTKVSGTANCVSNIKLAAKKCNGIILPSGYEFSFNNTVGEQTEATGFKTADAILDGKIIQAYGGGICQVSTTIFAAAVYANLDILEHCNRRQNP